jgi:imidazolonepropionase-like amidohydrolase
MSNVRAWVAIAAVSMAAPLLAQTGEPPAEVVIRDVSIVDVEAGRVLPGRDIVVRGTRVERITVAGGALPRGKTLIQGRGKFAMPGLIDGPVRLAGFSPATLQGLLAAGVTAVVDEGTDLVQLTRWRRDLDEGRLYAPRIAQACGTPTSAAEAAPRTSPDRPGAIHDELVRLATSAHRTPAQALRTVTLDRARTLCFKGLGTIAAGAPADLVVLAGNPLDDIRHTQTIDAVVFRGEVFTRAHVTQLRRGTLPAPTPPR